MTQTEQLRQTQGEDFSTWRVRHRRLRIAEMDTPHIQNSLRALREGKIFKGAEKSVIEGYIGAFETELRSREEARAAARDNAALSPWMKSHLDSISRQTPPPQHPLKRFDWSLSTTFYLLARKLGELGRPMVRGTSIRRRDGVLYFQVVTLAGPEWKTETVVEEGVDIKLYLGVDDETLRIIFALFMDTVDGIVEGLREVGYISPELFQQDTVCPVEKVV